MERRILACIMLTLLLVSAIDFAAFSFVTRATNTDQGSIDWWFMFRHDENRTGYSTINVLTPIGSFKNLTATGMIRSSPAVFDDAVFAGSTDGYVYRWNMTTFDRRYSSKYGAIYSSPCVVGGVVYVGSDDSNVYALDANNLTMIHAYPTVGAVKSSPVVVDNVLYAGSSDGYLYAWNVSTYKEMWRFWTASPVESSPTVSGDIVVFGTDDGRIYALDTKRGRLEWFNDTNGSVVSSPAVADGMVFVGSNDTHVYALNATNGAIVWNYPTGGNVTSSPAIADDMVFVGSDGGYLYALNATSGALGEAKRLIWNYTTGGPIHSSPAVTANGIVIVGSLDNKTYAFNVTTGEQIGLPYATNGPVYSSPAIAQCMARGMVFIGSDDGNVHVFTLNKPPVAGFTHSPDNPVIYQTTTFNASSSNSTTGNITSYSWNFGDGNYATNMHTPIAVHVYETAGIYIVTLNVTDNLAFNSTSQPITVLEAWPMFRHDTTHWGNSTSLAPPTNGTLWSQAIGPVDYSSPAVLNDAVFIGSTNGTFYALNATDNGSVIWSHLFGDPIYSSPAVVDNLVFIASENGTVSAWYTNGTFLWTNHANGKIISSPTVSSNRVFIGSENSHLYAFDEMNGTQLWDITLDATIDSSPAVAYGRVFVGSWNGRVYAINETTGGIIQSYQIGAQIHINSSPTVADGKVFIGAGNGIYAFNLGLVPQWNYSTGGLIDSSPAVAYGRVFVGSKDGNLYAFDSGSGAKLWNKTIGSVGWSSPAIAEGKVFIGSEDGTIHALSIAENGTEKWNYHTNGTVKSSPAILNDTLYIGSGDGNLYAFHKDVHDIAVLNVTPAPTTVYQGDLVNINVALMNEGSYNETDINVTVYYNETTIENAPINLTRGEQRTLTIPWDTSSIPSSNLPANFTISANATLISDDDLTNNNRTYYGSVFVKLPEIDLAVINVTTLNKTVVGQGVVGEEYTMNIIVTVENPGASTETFNVTTYANTTTIETKEVTLTNRQSAPVSFTWNTTGFAYGNYTLSAYAWPVPGENNTANNNFTCSVPVHVGVPGDVSGTTPGAYDGIVNMKDVAYLVTLFQTKPTKDNWDPNADINNDGVVDMKDIAIAIAHFNQHE